MKKKIVVLLIILVIIVAIILVRMVSLNTEDNNTESQAAESNDIKKEESKPKYKTINDLNIGDLVVDDSWQWESKVGYGYTGSGLEKPVIWIVVAKDHYDLDEEHVTLLSKEILGRYSFDTSTNRGSSNGSNNWGDSGKDNADRGIRTFLNEVFTEKFSNLFNSIVLDTNVPTAHWETGETYYTSDRVFIPCRSEIDSDKRDVHQAGKLLEYFSVDNYVEEINRRKAQLIGISDTEEEYKKLDNYWNYLTRTPSKYKSDFIYRVVFDGNYSVGAAKDDLGFWGMRPLVNVKANTRVSETMDESNVYKIMSND